MYYTHACVGGKREQVKQTNCSSKPSPSFLCMGVEWPLVIIEATFFLCTFKLYEINECNVFEEQP